RGLNLRDLAMALWLEFGPEGQDPQFSLDPDDPKNPTGPWLRAVYIPQTLQGRTMGAELFNGDLMLKELAFQTMLSPQGKLVEWARQLTSRYDELATESTALARVRELAKAVAIAKSLKSAGVPIDLAKVAMTVNGDHTPTITKINAFSVGWQREQRTPFHEGT